MADKTPDSSIIAKLHDLLKLGDSKYHWCPTKHPDAAAMEKAHPDLWKALRHHCVTWFWRADHQCGLNRVDRETFCISYADHKASAISRRLRQAYTSHRVYHVWKHEPGDAGKFQPIDQIFEEAISCTDLSKLYAKYRCSMEERAESAKPEDGSSFTSLRTHVELTASWADFLLRNADRYGLPKDVDTAYKFRKPIEKAKVVLVRCKIRTHGRLARLRDLQIVREIEDRKKDAVKSLGGGVLYELPDEILVPMHPDDAAEVADRLKPILSTNYYVEFTEALSPFLNGKANGEGFLHNFDKLFGRFPGIAHPHLEDPIVPDDRFPASLHAIICDLCQLAPARVEYPKDVYPEEDDPVSEYLCDSCADLRKESKTRAKKLATWEESLGSEQEETNGERVRPRVCMVKVSLDMRELLGALKNAFQTTFTKELKRRPLDGQDLGFSIMQEFVLDYNRFLGKFHDAVLALGDGSRYDEENRDEILDGFMALRIKKDSEVADITRRYVELYDQCFPRLKGPTFPIKLSVSCSHIKHPFLEHWEVLDKPTSAINVQSVRKAQLGVTFDQFKALESFGRNPEKRVSSFLHNLADLYDRTGSQLLVKFTLLEKQDDQRKVVGPFMDGTVHPGQILNYYKLFVQDAKP